MFGILRRIAYVLLAAIAGGSAFAADELADADLLVEDAIETFTEIIPVLGLYGVFLIGLQLGRLRVS